ncbi:MAG: hypothetical protein ACD_3C00026G0008 [uncultured bacterium (gcode 4)]|uniref:O-antigen polymerase n=1 Tax=uncultured bacterium (gcode 4) TaxID=1234023 RepID=K2G347_9BACT|nr:MAG: hypothetical protein ACD_3C00026G0008 [uncultured bacterium (gcode 4)]
MYFDKLYKALLVILPFHVLVSVFFDYKIWISGFWIYKEILVIALLWILIHELYKLKKMPKFDILDFMIFGYFGYLLLISLVNFTWLKPIIYGWRYDFEFLLMFLVSRHWGFLLKDKLSSYIRLFLLSWWAAIIIWLLVRFVFGETILVNFWFSPKLSSWSFDQGVPIYHWIEWANVRRFQWIFDWPNQAAFFLIVYSWVLFHYLRNKKDFQFYLYSALAVIWWLVFLTYSRSSLLGIIAWLWLVFLLNLKTIVKKYKIQSISVLILMILLWGAFYVRYGWVMDNIILRAWSSKWHIERMIIWFKQFSSKPLGQGLASSWPWYRITHDTKWVDEKNFIPESWYVQQLVEWWIIGFFLFVWIMYLMTIKIYFLSKPIFFSFIAILFMNLLLHTFEASYISLMLFMLLGLFLRKKENPTLSL